MSKSVALYDVEPERRWDIAFVPENERIAVHTKLAMGKNYMPIGKLCDGVFYTESGSSIPLRQLNSWIYPL